jgi:hypothetical protein
MNASGLMHNKLTLVWDRKLSRPITLSDGRKLATLRCAAECLIATFDGISHWPALEHARDPLMTAARQASAGTWLRQPIR